MSELTILALLTLAVGLAIWVGTLRARSAADAERDIAVGKQAESEARERAAQEETKRAEEASVIKEQIDDAVSNVSPGAERIRARWDLLHQGPNGRPAGSGHDPE